MNKVVVALFVVFSANLSAITPEQRRWEKHAANVTITRDDFGIAHVVGKSDADAVFGMLYAQAEDDFFRIENNYLIALGRLAEADGEKAIWSDLRARMFVNEASMKKLYKGSPAWLKKLMVAFADGLNFYLAKHPSVHARALKHFEPWMPLAFSEGSIGGDIETIDLVQLQNFYEAKASPLSLAARNYDLRGSNGIAIAPAKSVNGHPLLLINPHTSFYFRSEMQMTSKEGLNCYGAATWGQFFLYQAFNEHLGFMHTSSMVDSVDEFLENTRDAKEEKVALRYKTTTGMAERSFTIYRTRHGPVVRKLNDKWVSVSLMQRPLQALSQSYKRMKAKGLKEFKKTLAMQADSSNNTVYADRAGNIALFYATFVPRRSALFDYTKPVDGQNRAADWKGVLGFDELPQVVNPKSGWVFNSNNAPWSAAGEGTLKKSDYPPYIDSGEENARGEHILALMKDRKSLDLESLRALAFDGALTWFEKPLPALIKAFDDLPSANALKSKLAGPIDLLKKWDMRWSLDSKATTLAIYWGEALLRDKRPLSMVPETMLAALETASNKLVADFGKWDVPWGEVNRFQRLTGDIEAHFSDEKPSTPVPFAAGPWGSLASYYSKTYKGSKRRYGTGGNSFVAVVEFGPKVRAKAVLVGGQSSDPKSKHFDDQVARYVSGQLRDVYFYPEDLKGHVERTYHPGL